MAIIRATLARALRASERFLAKRSESRKRRDGRLKRTKNRVLHLGYVAQLDVEYVERRPDFIAARRAGRGGLAACTRDSMFGRDRGETAASRARIFVDVRFLS